MQHAVTQTARKCCETAHIPKVMKAVVLFLSSRNFFKGAKRIVMQISFVILSFLLTKILGKGQKSFGGGVGASGFRVHTPVREGQLYS